MVHLAITQCGGSEKKKKKKKPNRKRKREEKAVREGVKKKRKKTVKRKKNGGGAVATKTSGFHVLTIGQYGPPHKHHLTEHLNGFHEQRFRCPSEECSYIDPIIRGMLSNTST